MTAGLSVRKLAPDLLPALADMFGAASQVDRLIREAIERGDFENLPGEGKPIPGAGATDDDLWWVRGWVKRNLRSEDQEEPADPDSQSPSSSS